jgi:hypothetical protein
MSVRLSNYDLDDIRQQALYKAHKKIEGMLMLVEFIEGQIENVILALSKKTEESVDVFEFHERNNKELTIKGIFYPSICQSLLISIYSILEVSMNDLCDAYSILLNTRIKYQDISGKGIQRAALYLKKVANLENVKNHGKWDFLVILGELRNCIVHNDSYPKDQKQTKEFREKLFISISSEKEKVFISFDHLKTYVAAIKEYLDYIYGLKSPNA